MTILFFVLGFFIGLTLAWYIMSKKSENLTNQYSLLNEEKVRLQTELNLLSAENNNIENKIAISVEENMRKAMKFSNETFINMASQTFDKHFSEIDNELKISKLDFKKILAPLADKVENYDKKVNDFQLESSKNLGSVKAYLQELSLMQQELSKQTNSLVGALKSPRIRGRWGEIGLRRIVEYSGLNEYCDFSEQVSDSVSGLRPDLIISLPENRQIIVDSKLPLEAYLNAVEDNNDETKLQFMKKHLSAVKDNLRRLSAKKYFDNFDASIDFVVMYIEIEPALSAALRLDHSLINEALSHNVIIATPTTFIALLQTIAYGWRQHKMSENAQAILKETKEFYSRISVFTEHFDQLGKQVNSLVSKYNQATGSWSRRVEPGLRKIEELGVKNTKKDLKEISSVELKAKGLS